MSLIAYTVQEVRKFFIFWEITISKTIDDLFHWSLWRRKHQAIAMAYHYKKRGEMYKF